MKTLGECKLNEYFHYTTFNNKTLAAETFIGYVLGHISDEIVSVELCLIQTDISHWQKLTNEFRTFSGCMLVNSLKYETYSKILETIEE